MENELFKKSDENEMMKMVLGTIEEYYNAMNASDLEGTLSMIHSESPTQLQTRQVIGQVMNAFKLNNELLEKRYIGSDDDYIYVKIKQKITKVKVPEFHNNISDLILAMRKDGESWKIWCMMPLETSLIK